MDRSSESGKLNMPKKIRVPPQIPPSDPTSAIDEDAEERQLVSARNEHKRDEKSRTIIAIGMWIILSVILAIIAISVFTIGYHFLTPKEWHWLDKPMVQEIKNFLLSGAIVGLGTNYIGRYLKRS